MLRHCRCRCFFAARDAAAVSPCRHYAAAAAIAIALCRYAALSMPCLSPLRQLMASVAFHAAAFAAIMLPAYAFVSYYALLPAMPC